MSLAKAVVTGVVYRAPEKRFTQNDVAIYGLTLNIDEKEETLIRVISRRKALGDILDQVKQGDKLLIDGRLQTANSKASDGSVRKYFELDANDIQILSGNTSAVSSPISSENENLVTFAETDFTEDTLIDDEEIPF